METWGIFPDTSTQVPWARCFTTTVDAASIGCDCEFNNQPITSAIIGYSPNVPYGTPDGGMAIDRGRVYVRELHRLSRLRRGHYHRQFLLALDGRDERLPLIGSLNDGGFTYGPPGTTESYSVLITLPDPMAFSATAPPTFTNSTAAVRELDFTCSYGNQHFNIPSVPNDGKVNVGYLDVAHVPPGTWWNVMDP